MIRKLRPAFSTNLWILSGMIIPAMIVIHPVVVSRLSNSLTEEKFGEDYLDYKSRVRRWI